ncbi:MAG: hypothetical protein H6895_08605 [Defluviimonas sp.]|uniref:hypothetical protein n=1 Tax=Albidovulum sp. TaxID=1872424 RepID=UPI002A29CDD7|nr:hypothetical protein [Defluviimonas sp.]
MVDETMHRRSQPAAPAGGGTLMVPVSMVAASLAGLAVSLLAPHLLAPSDYGRFATAWALGQLVASLGYEWMRFGVLRFAGGADAARAAGRLGLLAGGYRATTLLLLLAAVTAIGLWRREAVLVAAVLVFAACNGIFDGRQALLRARFDNAAFARGRLIRSVLSLVFALAAAQVTGTAEAVLIGLALSFPAAMVLDRAGAAHPPARAAWAEFGPLFAFGLFAALATNLALAGPALQRALALAHFAPVPAAALTLAFDLAGKAVAVTGLAVNVVMMQQSIRTAEFGPAEDQPHQAGRQIAVTAAFIAPAALGVALVAEPLAGLAVPSDLRPDFVALAAPASLSAGLLALRLFGLDPLFVVRRRTALGVPGPLVSALALGALFLAPSFGLAALAWAMAATAALGLAVAALALAGSGPIAWPLADLARVAFGCATMVAAAWLVPVRAGWIGLALTVLAATLAYAAAVWATDAAGLRQALLRQRRGRRRSGEMPR